MLRKMIKAFYALCHCIQERHRLAFCSRSLISPCAVYGLDRIMHEVSYLKCQRVVEHGGLSNNRSQTTKTGPFDLVVG